jgi:hypothetical protein
LQLYVQEPYTCGPITLKANKGPAGLPFVLVLGDPSRGPTQPARAVAVRDSPHTSLDAAVKVDCKLSNVPTNVFTSQA